LRGYCFPQFSRRHEEVPPFHGRDSNDAVFSRSIWHGTKLHEVGPFSRLPEDLTRLAIPCPKELPDQIRRVGLAFEFF